MVGKEAARPEPPINWSETGGGIVWVVTGFLQFEKRVH